MTKHAGAGVFGSGLRTVPRPGAPVLPHEKLSCVPSAIERSIEFGWMYALPRTQVPCFESRLRLWLLVTPNCGSMWLDGSPLILYVSDVGPFDRNWAALVCLNVGADEIA